MRLMATGPNQIPEFEAMPQSQRTLYDVYNGFERYNYPRLKEIFERSVSKLEGYGYLMEPEMIISCKRNLHEGYEDLHYYDDPISNESEERSFIKRWFLDTTKRTYAAMDFLPPPMQVPDGVFNTWYRAMPGSKASNVIKFQVTKLQEMWNLFCITYRSWQD